MIWYESNELHHNALLWSRTILNVLEGRNNIVAIYLKWNPLFGFQYKHGCHHLVHDDWQYEYNFCVFLKTASKHPHNKRIFIHASLNLMIIDNNARNSLSPSHFFRGYFFPERAAGRNIIEKKSLPFGRSLENYNRFFICNSTWGLHNTSQKFSTIVTLLKIGEVKGIEESQQPSLRIL